jgi:hypothetical protein
MPKHYIIPIDQQGNAYLGRKSMVNPYTQQPMGWGQGAPNIFGGNLQNPQGDEALDAIDNTLYLETREESRYKVDLNQLNLVHKVQVHQAALANGVQMTFYAIRGNFVYDPQAFFPDLLLEQAKYQECTGEVLQIALGPMANANAAAASAHVLAAYTAAFGAPAADVRMVDFNASAGMVALCNAANLLAAGQI